MKKLLLVIDVQKDFINEYTKQISSKIKELVNSNKFNLIAFTRFINNEDSIWCKELNYKGCITEEQREIVVDTNGYKVFDKKTYTALNDELKQFIEINQIDEIYLCGFDTDACVQKTALDLFEQNYNVFILEDYCMSHAGFDIHDLYIENMKRLIGKNKII